MGYTTNLPSYHLQDFLVLDTYRNVRNFMIRNVIANNRFKHLKNITRIQISTFWIYFSAVIHMQWKSIHSSLVLLQSSAIARFNTGARASCKAAALTYSLFPLECLLWTWCLVDNHSAL